MHYASLTALLIASLVGSAHCAGMCGGFVAFYSGKSDKPLLSHLGYNFGRLCTYLIFGAAAGALGSSLDKAGAFAGIQQLSLALVAALLILWGVTGIIGIPAGKLLPQKVSNQLTRLGAMAGAVVLQNTRLSWPVRSYLIGLLTTWLPCGWLYGFVALAAASADVLQGMTLLGVFWLGTLPMLATIGGISQAVASPLRRYLPRVTAVLLLAAGVFALSGHSQLLAATINRPACPKCHQQTP